MRKVNELLGDSSTGTFLTCPTWCSSWTSPTTTERKEALKRLTTCTRCWGWR